MFETRTRVYCETRTRVCCETRTRVCCETRTRVYCGVCVCIATEDERGRIARAVCMGEAAQ